MSKSLCVLLFAALMAAPAYGQDTGLEGPAPERQAGKVDLARKVTAYTGFVNDPQRFTSRNAAQQLNAGYDEVLSLSLETVNLQAVDADPHGLLRGLFGLMLAIDARCAEFDGSGVYTPEIANAKRRAFRAIRYLREAIMLRTSEIAPDKLYEHGKPAFANAYPEHHWTVHPDFRAGGVAALPRTVILLCMGGSNVSATIARSADEDNTFSHLAVGYRSIAPQVVDGKQYPAGSMFLVESLIETGVIIKPFDEHYKGVDRDVIFIARDRSKQPQIDAAMDAFFTRANDAIKAGKPLKYDFSMGAGGATGALDPTQESESADQPEGILSDPDAYFCAAIGHEVFAKAGLELFPVRSLLNTGPNSRKLFESWGMDPDAPVMAPGDADISPVLFRVAEAGRLQDLLDNHLRQAVLNQMFRWMDEDGYYLRVPWYTKIITAIVGGLNDTFLDLGKVPSGMDKKILRSFLALDKAAELYYKALKKGNEAFHAEQGRNMQPKEMVAHLDSIRDSVKGTRKWFRSPNHKGWFGKTKDWLGNLGRGKKKSDASESSEGPR